MSVWKGGAAVCGALEAPRPLRVWVSLCQDSAALVSTPCVASAGRGGCCQAAFAGGCQYRRYPPPRPLPPPAARRRHDARMACHHSARPASLQRRTPGPGRRNVYWLGSTCARLPGRHAARVPHSAPWPSPSAERCWATLETRGSSSRECSIQMTSWASFSAAALPLHC